MRIVQTVLLCALLLILVSCDLFTTRSTEPPFESGSPWIPPIQVEQIFSNMTQAIAELNSDHYMRCFFGPDDLDEEYIFIPTPNAAGWSLAEDWGYDEEKQTIEYLFSLISPESPGYLAFGEGEQLMYGNEDSVWVTKPYTLSISVEDPGSNMPQMVTGEADFYLAQNSIGYWAIYRWEDIEGDPPWTELKAWLY